MFADNLRKIRLKNGLTQTQLSEQLEVSRQAISKYESGLAEPNYDNLIAIAKYFDVSIDYLLLSKPDSNATKRSDNLTIISQLAAFGIDRVASYHTFAINQVLGGKKNSPKAALWGTYKSGLFGDKKCLLAYYRNYESAQRELVAITAAMQNGQSNYELQYFAPVKSQGLDYIIDE